MTDTPEVPAFREIDIKQIGQVALEPGQRITGFMGWRDFSIIEQRAADQLISAHPSRQVERPHETLMRVPLGDLLRPKRFNGRLRNASALVIPYDQEAVSRYPRTVKYHPTETGLTFICAADLSTSKGPVGTLFREISYYVNVSTPVYVEGRPVRGGTRRLQRVVNHDYGVQPIEELIATMRRDSAANARALMVLGLHRIFSAGLPGLGKKQ